MLKYLTPEYHRLAFVHQTRKLYQKIEKEKSHVLYSGIFGHFALVVFSTFLVELCHLKQLLNRCRPA